MPEIRKPTDGHVGVAYTSGESTHVHDIRAKTTNTTEETLAQIRRRHPGITMEQVHVAGAEVDGDQPITDWLSRTSIANCHQPTSGSTDLVERSGTHNASKEVIVTEGIHASSKKFGGNKKRRNNAPTRHWIRRLGSESRMYA
jgi:hypothetical protein